MLFLNIVRLGVSAQTYEFVDDLVMAACLGFLVLVVWTAIEWTLSNWKLALQTLGNVLVGSVGLFPVFITIISSFGGSTVSNLIATGVCIVVFWVAFFAISWYVDHHCVSD